MKSMILLLTIMLAAIGHNMVAQNDAIEKQDSTVTFGKDDVFVLLTSISVTSPGPGMVLQKFQYTSEYCTLRETERPVDDTLIVFTHQYTSHELEMSRDSLQKLSPIIDMNKELPLLKGTRFQELYRMLEGKRVWVIDRNTMTKETVTLLETTAICCTLGGCFSAGERSD